MSVVPNSPLRFGLVGRRFAPIFQGMIKTQNLRKPLNDDQRDLLMIGILLLLDALVVYQHVRLQEAIELLSVLARQYGVTG